DDQRDFRDTVCRKAALFRVLANDLLIWSDVDAVNLVPGYETLDPLDFGPELAQHTAGRSRNVLQLLRSQSSGAWDLALNYVLWHWDLPVPGSRLCSARSNGRLRTGFSPERLLHCDFELHP